MAKQRGMPSLASLDKIILAKELANDPESCKKMKVLMDRVAAGEKLNLSSEEISPGSAPAALLYFKSVRLDSST